MFVECVRMYSLPSSQRALYTPWLNDGRTEVEKNKNDIVSLSLFPHRMFLSFLLCGATRDFMVVMSPRSRGDCESSAVERMHFERRSGGTERLGIFSFCTQRILFPR